MKIKHLSGVKDILHDFTHYTVDHFHNNAPVNAEVNTHGVHIFVYPSPNLFKTSVIGHHQQIKNVLRNSDCHL